MSDNFLFTPGAGATGASKDVGGVQYQRVQPVTGTTTVTDVSATNPMPVISTALLHRIPNTYAPIAAGKTNSTLGPTGAAGDYLYGLTMVPGNTSPGAVSIKDGGGSSMTVFTGGAGSVGSLQPFFCFVGATSTAGAWSVTTGADISVIGCGNFTP